MLTFFRTEITTRKGGGQWKTGDMANVPRKSAQGAWAPACPIVQPGFLSVVTELSRISGSPEALSVQEPVPLDQQAGKLGELCVSDI